MKKTILNVFSCVALLCATANAQTITAAFTGTVTDESGAVVPNVKITAVNSGTKLVYTAVTNQSGIYNLLFLPLGNYSVTAEASGFKRTQSGPYNLEGNQTARVDIKLSVGETTQSVEVTAAASALQTESAQTGTTINSTQLSSLPLGGRNFAALTLMIPGAVTTDPKGFSVSRFGSRPFVNGNREQTNNFMLDGVDINDSIDNRIGYQPNVDALEEMKVLTGNAAADYGNAGGAAVILSMKSGTNEFHGNVFEFLSNNKLNSNGYFRNRTTATATRLAFKQNIFGGTIGGPIMKNRAFFFMDYEGTTQRTGGPSSASVAPQSWRNGDLSQFPVTSIVDPTNGQPFAGKQIPASRITNPVAKYLFANPSIYPLPNQAGTGSLGITNNYVGATASKIDNNQGDIKGDFRISDKNNLSTRYSNGRYSQAGSQAALVTSMPSGTDGPTQSVVLNWTHTLNPTVVNEARVAFSRVGIDEGVLDWSGKLGADGNQKFGISGGQPIPGLSNVTLGGGLSSVGSGASITSTVDNKFIYYDNLTWQKGRHLLKMGAQFTRYQQNRYYAGNNGALGSFTYNGTYTNLDFADFLVDALNSKGRGAVVGKWGHRSWNSALFFQDDFKMRQGLTINIGMRWEHMQPIYEVADRQVNIDTFTGKILVPGKNGAPRSLYNAYWKQFMPRIGFAWTPSSFKNRLVVRGGYAYMSFMEGTGANLRLPLNPPFFIESNLTYDSRTPGSITRGFADVQTTGVSLDMARPAIAGIVPQLQGRAWDVDLKPQTTQQINLTAEYLFTKTTSLTVGYVGQRGRHLVAPHEANNPLPGTGLYATWTNQETRRPLYNILPNVGNIALTEASSTMDYNSMQSTLRHRFSQRLELLSSYTWGNTLTDNRGYYGGGVTANEGAYWQNANCRTCNRGPAFFDARHNFSLGGVYELPFGKGQKFGTGMSRPADMILGGWKLNFSMATRSGFPITVMNGVNRTGQAPRGNVRANFYRKLTVDESARTIDNYFGLPADRATYFCGIGVNDGKCAYGQPADGAFGNAGIGTERLPSFFNMDAAIGKKFMLTERKYFEFRTELGNMLNHVSWGQMGVSITSPAGFGQVTNQIQGPRSIQFALKFYF